MPRRRAAVPLTLPGIDGARKPGPVSPQARAMSSASSKRQAPAPKPWQCAILAVDTAANSGWSIWLSGHLMASGEVDTNDAEKLRAIASHEELCAAGPPVLVLEAPYGGHKHPGMVATLVALGVAKERWLRAWRDAGEARGRVVSVQPSTWRSAVLGGVVRGMKRDQVRSLERFVARDVKQIAQGGGRYPGEHEVGADEAAAILIGKWATYAPQVGAVIGKRARDKSVAAWTGGVR